MWGWDLWSLSAHSLAKAHAAIPQLFLVLNLSLPQVQKNNKQLQSSTW